VIQNVVTLAFAVNNLPRAREAYARGRELRGLQVREGALDMIFSAQGIWTASLMTLLYAAVAFLVYRARTHLSGRGDWNGASAA
jgi:hypothetical protein